MVQKDPKILGASLAQKLNDETMMGVKVSILKWLHCREESRQIPFFVKVDFNRFGKNLDVATVTQKLIIEGNRSCLAIADEVSS